MLALPVLLLVSVALPVLSPPQRWQCCWHPLHSLRRTGQSGLCTCCLDSSRRLGRCWQSVPVHNLHTTCWLQEACAQAAGQQAARLGKAELCRRQLAPQWVLRVPFCGAVQLQAV